MAKAAWLLAAGLVVALLGPRLVNAAAVNWALVPLLRGAMRPPEPAAAGCGAPESRAAAGPGSAWPAVLAGVQAQRAGCSEAAIHWWQAALAADPGNTAAGFWLGRAYEGQGDWPRALDYYRLAPASAYQWVLAGRAAEARGDWPAAYAQYQAAVQIAPDLGEAHFYYGQALAYYVGDYAAALTEYEAALRLGFPDGFIWSRIAHAHALSGRIAEAVALLDAHQQDNALANAIRGQAHLADGQPTAAIAAYQRAIAQSPTDPWLHLGLGEAYRAAGDRAQAVAAWQQALALSPGFAPAVQALCQANACPPEPQP